VSGKTLNVALVGTGFMGRTHSNAYLKAPKFFDLPIEPVMHSIVSRNPQAVAPFARKWGWQRWDQSWQEACSDPQVGLVDLGTPNHLHAEHAICALEHGKHVACEKPLAGTLDDARAMAKAAKKARRKNISTSVWFVYRRVAAVALAHQMVQAGKLGRIYHVRAAYLQDWGGPDTPLLWRFKGKEAGSGAHGDLNAHIIDMARFITGDEFSEIAGAIEETFIKKREIIEDTSSGGAISGKGAKKSTKKRYGKSTVDDAVLFLARFKGGAIGSFEATRLGTGGKNANRIEIHGEKGALRYDFERMNELDWYDNTLPPAEQGWSTIHVTRNGAGHPYVDAWWPDGHGLGYEHGFINQVADMMNVIAGQPPVVPLPDFEDAYQTQRVLEAAIQSARNRCPVPMSQVK